MGEEGSHPDATMNGHGNMKETPEAPADSPETRKVETIQETRGGKDNPGSVRILHGVLGLITAPEFELGTEEEIEARLELNRMVHRMLLVGLALSTAALVIGVTLSAIFHRPLPTQVSGFRQLADGLKKGSPAGFLSLGILLLIATPVLRVLGSLAEFVEKRDWHYAVITSIVLIILTLSVMTGSG